ncbi:MAG: hemerythrin domain-containing protein [Burkholderiaceae bacterium]
MCASRLHRIAMPGEAAPAGFEQPFEMLSACHQRVERMLGLIQRIREHLPTHGCDAQVAQAALDVIRYFDEAAPRHHEDEELHVFPALLAQGDTAVRVVTERLIEDHRQMLGLWAAMRALLQSLAQAQADGARALSDDENRLLDAFDALYRRHLHEEDQLAYPAARRILTDTALATMSEDMQVRRGVAPAR